MITAVRPDEQKETYTCPMCGQEHRWCDEPCVGHDVPNGIEHTFPDGYRARLTIYGISCTCGRKSGVPCEHVKALLPAYTLRKWVLAEENRRSWGRGIYQQIGIDDRIFIPPTVDWAREYRGEPFVWLDDVQEGRLFLFPDGASIWIGRAHPLGRTDCSLCGTRDCRHYQLIDEDLREAA